MYSVWYTSATDAMPKLFVSDVPTQSLANRIVASLAEEFGTVNAWAERD